MAKGGRRPSIDREACRAAILAAVQYGPVPTSTIVSVSGFSRTTVKEELEGLLRAGQLQHLGASRGSTWALPGWAPPSVDVSADVDQADDEVAGDLLEADDTEADDVEPDAETELVEFDPPPQRVRGQRTLYPAGTRQAAKKATVTDPAWWVGLTRDEFSTQAAKRADVMRVAKENSHVPVRILR